MNSKYLLYLFFCLPALANAQTDIGLEFQVYPTGILPGATVSFAIGEQSALHVRAGLNIFDHRDLGVQEQETGDGVGFTIGYQYYFGPDHNQFFLGVRSDFWWNEVDWETAGQTGTTQITVVQPTVMGGYGLLLANDRIVLEPTIAFGFEINVVTEGEETGQGLIGLAGLRLAYRL